MQIALLALGMVFSLGAELFYIWQIAKRKIRPSALRCKHHSGWERLDTIWVIAAMLAAFAWWKTSDPVYGLAVALLIDFIGYCALAVKQVRLPAQESSFAWGCAGVAYAISIATPFLVGSHFSLTALLFSGLNVVGCLLVFSIDQAQRQIGRISHRAA